MFTTLHCKDIGIRQFNFGAKTQFLQPKADRVKIVAPASLAYTTELDQLY